MKIANIGNLENIEFNVRMYQLRHDIYVKGYGYRTIAGEHLEDALFDDAGHYVSDEARNLDESSFFFVKDSLLATVDDRALAKRISADVA